jgi:hypothetical protein
MRTAARLLLATASITVLLPFTATAANAQDDDGGNWWEDNALVKSVTDTLTTCLDGAKGCPESIATLPLDISTDVAGDISSVALDELEDRADSAFQEMAVAFVRSGLDLTMELTTFWVDIPSRVRDDSAAEIITEIDSYFERLSVLLVVAGIMFSGIRLVVRRGAEPAADLMRATVVFVIAAGCGVLLVEGFAAATDQWSSEILAEATTDENLEQVAESIAGSGGVNAPLLLVIGMVMILGGLMQAALMVAREVSLIIAAGLIVFAASGQFFRASSGWIWNLAGFIVPLIMWKPIAAILNAIALDFMAAGGQLNPVIGVVMLIGAAFAWRPLRSVFELFNPSNANAGYSKGGGFASVAGTGAMMIGSRSVPPEVSYPTTPAGSAPGRSASASSGGSSAGEAAGTAAAAAGGPVGVAAATGVKIVETGKRSLGRAAGGRS